jgi:DNA-binding Lrp family transcriptional regulator
MELTDIDRKIINRLSQDLPSDMIPFASIAHDLGLDEKDLLDRIEDYREHEILRRFAVIVAHHSAGFVANAMVAWQVPENRIEETAQTMVQFREVSHCYERLSYPHWPYNIYTMIHGRTREQCLAVVRNIAEKTDINEYKVLFTAREFKKRSMQYFDS